MIERNFGSRDTIRLGKRSFNLTPYTEAVSNVIFNAPLSTNLTDSKSSTTATFVRAGSIYVFDNSDILQTYGSNTAGFGPDGLFSDGPTTNLAGANYRTVSAWAGAATASNNITGIDGGANAGNTVTDSSAAAFENRNLTISVADSSDPVSMSFFVKKDSDETRFPRFAAQLIGGTTVQYQVDFNTKTGAIQNASGVGTSSVSDVGNWWRVCLTVQNNGSGNALGRIIVYPAYTFPIGTPDLALTGSIGLDWAQIEDDFEYCSSPFPGASSRATQEGTAGGNGAGWPLASLDSGITTALGGTGSISCTIKPMFDYDQITTGNYGIATFNDDTTSGLYFDGAGNISINDGTNTVSVSTNWDNGDGIEIIGAWSGSDLKLKVTVNEGTPSSSSGTFDGGIPFNDTLRLAFGNTFPFFTKDLKIYNQDIL